jgi:hypothetical protein
MDPAARLVVSLTEDFGIEEAWRVTRQIEGAIAGRAVLLDFTACQNPDIFAVTLLACAVEREGGALQARGLTRHDLRILEYVGLALGAAGSHQ